MSKLTNKIISLVFIFSVSFSFADVTQNTEGNCSPNINEINGNVTIDCGTKIYGTLQNKGYKKNTSNLPKVKYYIDNKTDVYKSLSANVNGQTYNIISEKDEQCIYIESQKDFDGNGLTDVLLSHTACGGNCCPNSFSIIYYSGDGYFKKGEYFGDSWQDPVVEKWKDKWSVILVSSSQGVGNTSLYGTRNRYLFDEGNTLKVSESQKMQIKAEINLWATDFDPEKEDQIKSIKYDLNGDGKLETIKAIYWQRWGSMMWDVVLQNGKEISSNSGCKRVGVLKSSNNGMLDLVCNESTILKWDGSVYK